MDDANHLVMQCPSLQDKRNVMFHEISQIRDGYGRYLISSGADLLLTLLGKPHSNVPDEIMEEIWILSAEHISNMYRLKIKQGEG